MTTFPLKSISQLFIQVFLRANGYEDMLGNRYETRPASNEKVLISDQPFVFDHAEVPENEPIPCEFWWFGTTV